MKRRTTSRPVDFPMGWHALGLCEGRGIKKPRPSRTQGVPPRRASQNRKGAFLLIAMVCLMLTSGLLGTLLKMASANRNQAQFEAASLQAQWLAESALDRAAAKLSADANYPGETWDIKPEELGGPHAGQVVITAKPGDGSALRNVEVVARFPLESPRSVKRTRRLTIVASAPRAESETEGALPASAEKPEEGEAGR